MIHPNHAIARKIPVMRYFSGLEVPTVDCDPVQWASLQDFRQKAMNTGLPRVFRSKLNIENRRCHVRTFLNSHRNPIRLQPSLF